MIALVQAGMQANQLASPIDRAGNITNFLKTQKRRVLYFLCVIKKGAYQGNIPFLKTIHIMLILTGITNGYWHARFFFDMSVPHPDVFGHTVFFKLRIG